MSIKGPLEPGEIREVTKAENQFNIALMVARNELVKRKDVMKDRLAPFNGGWRDLCLLLYLVDHVQDLISKTLPEKTIRRYVQYSQHGQLSIDIPSAIEPASYVPIEKMDLNELATWAIYGKCSTCILEGKEIKRCPLRKVLTQISPPEELTEHNRIMGCEYIKLGQMVVLDAPED